jgi:predicted house-cleaning NTP pyrophosphatase (Maf/HAM1 superfamily)
VEDNGVLKLTGIITDFSIWDDAIHLFAVKFHNQYNVYPNILLANDSTYRKIDLYAQMHPNRIVTADIDGNIETIETSNEPYNGLSFFTTEDYELECCLDYDLREGYFILVFDEVPDFDGEQVEKPEEKENIYTYKKIA